MPPAIQQDILINLKVVGKLDQLNRATKSLDILNQAGLRAINSGKSLIDTESGKMIKWQSAANRIDKVKQRMRKYDEQQKIATKNAKRFKFEFLGVMFAGQRMAKAFGDMITPSLELFGIQELYTLMLQDLMLPTIEPIADIFYGIVDSLMGLSDESKKAIGIFILAGYGVSKFADIMGTTVLAVSSFKLAFPALFAMLGKKITPYVDFSSVSAAFASLTNLAGLAMKGIGVYFMFKGLMEGFKGDFMGAITDTLMGIGFWKGNVWMIAAGFALKMVTDEGAMISVLKWTFKIGTVISNVLGEAVKVALFGAFGYKPNFEAMGLTDFASAWKQASEQFAIENKGWQMWGLEKKAPVYPSETVSVLMEEQNKLQAERDKLIRATGKNEEEAQRIWDQYKPKIQAVEDQIKSWQTQFQTSSIAVKTQVTTDTSSMNSAQLTMFMIQNPLISAWALLFKTKSNSVATTVSKNATGMGNNWTDMTNGMNDSITTSVNHINSSLSQITPYVKTIHETVEITSQGSAKYEGTTQAGGKSAPEAPKKEFKWYNPLTWFQHGGIVPGTPNMPVPIVAHGGETIIPAGMSSGTINLYVSYAINVSDRREMETMIKTNNTKLVDDLRRIVET